MKNFSKHYLAPVLGALLLVSGLAACQNSPTNAAETTAATMAVEEATVSESRLTETTPTETIVAEETEASTSTVTEVKSPETEAERAKNDSDYDEDKRELLGAEAALADDDLDLEDMLTYTLEDEYLARDTYISVMKTFGEIRPFINIKASEETHINLLLPLFEKYELELPNYVRDETAFSGTLQEAYEAGVHAEIMNIQMYENFLKEDLPADVADAFSRLAAASEKHLATFRRQAEKN